MMNVEGPVHTRMGPTMSDSAVTTQNRGGVLHWLTNWDSCVPISHLTHQERSPPSSSSSAAATDFSQLQHLSGIIDWW